jgi:hypothetical protein
MKGSRLTWNVTTQTAASHTIAKREGGEEEMCKNMDFRIVTV